MEALVQCSTVHYAIIEASSTKNDPERLVIAYSDETCLRGLIASPSIVGCGFKSREEAMAKVGGRIPDPRPSNAKDRLNTMWYSRQKERDAESVPGLVKNHGNIFRTLQLALATITVLFYSKNLFSVVLRAALGFPS